MRMRMRVGDWEDGEAGFYRGEEAGDEGDGEERW
jgi:hypothetical protein